jgi:anti-sigma factor ChrR (cupin superfamily)
MTDTTFHTAHRWELEWQDDIDVLTLGNGVQVKILFEDAESELLDLLIKFPPGYVEPEHVHHSTHSIFVHEGLQIVRGEHQRPGDYLWAAADEPHGPFEYPEGCVVFGSFRGASAHHRYPGSPGGEI